jgi:hypothetical protein
VIEDKGQRITRCTLQLLVEGRGPVLSGTASVAEPLT